MQHRQAQPKRRGLSLLDSITPEILSQLGWTKRGPAFRALKMLQ